MLSEFMNTASYLSTRADVFKRMRVYLTDRVDIGELLVIYMFYLLLFFF